MKAREAVARTGRPVVVLDANVLFPAQLRDLLMRLGAAGLIRVHWTDRIHEEWIRAVLEQRPDLSEESLERTRRLMEQALPGANVTTYGEAAEAATSVGLPDPDDEHVVAAAMAAEASFIVTENSKDFPAEIVLPLGVRAVRPDEFLLGLLDACSADVQEVLRTHRAALRKPPKSPEEYLMGLERVNLAGFVAAVRVRRLDI